MDAPELSLYASALNCKEFSMGLLLGIAGLPGSGKTTLFNALTGPRARTSAFSFTSKAPNVSAVRVPDERLAELQLLFQAKRIVHPEITFVDTAPPREGEPPDLTGKLISALPSVREADALIIVLRAFQDTLLESERELRPAKDLHKLRSDLILSDLVAVEKAIEKREKALKAGEKKFAGDVEVLRKIEGALHRGEPASKLDLPREETDLIKAFSFMTLKPLLLVANIGEKDLKQPGSPEVESLRRLAESEGIPLLIICAQVETELSELPYEEAESFARELGFELDTLEKFITAAYRTLDMVTFFTGGEKEVRAWTVPRGTTALRGAGKIHTDMEKGFERCEVVAFDDLARCGSLGRAKEQGLLHLEGRDYVLREGDVVHFVFARERSARRGER
jgi:GTP-binding protein YchF